MNAIKSVNFGAKNTPQRAKTDYNESSQRLKGNKSNDVVFNTAIAGVTAGTTAAGTVGGSLYGVSRFPNALGKEYFSALTDKNNLNKLGYEEKIIATNLVNIAESVKDISVNCIKSKSFVDKDCEKFADNLAKLPGFESISKWLENKANYENFTKKMVSISKSLLHKDTEYANNAASQLKELLKEPAGQENIERIENAFKAAVDKEVFKMLPDDFALNKLKHLPKKVVGTYAAVGALVAGTTAVLGSALVSKLTSKK